MSMKIAEKDKVKLRFPIGCRVECNCGSWKPGTITKHFYAQPSFPEGMCVPYQVQLDENKLIFVPVDDDRVCRAMPMPVADEWDEFPDEEIPDADKLPVTVITGFLGAGKTTLVNHILRGNHGKKVCVIENEFGAVNIDEGLVKENLNVAEEIISLDNGCACCTVRGDLLRALFELRKRTDQFDLLIVETTGLANPAPVVATFTQHPAIANHFRVDGIVCLVDCKFIKDHIGEMREEGAVNESVCQIAFADRVLMNKVDLVTKDEMKDIKETMQEINSFAELYETERSKVPLEKIMNLQAFSIERMTAAMDEFEIEPAAPPPGGDKIEEMDHEHGHESEHGVEPAASSSGGLGSEGIEACEAEPVSAHAHDHAVAEAPKKKKKHDLSGVGSLGLTCEGPLIAREFNMFMSDLLRYKSRDLYRSKGVLKFQEEGMQKFIFQGVHEQIQYTTAKEPWGADEPVVCKCVFIGRNLDHDKLKEGWKRCQANLTADKPEEQKGFLEKLLGSTPQKYE